VAGTVADSRLMAVAIDQDLQHLKRTLGAVLVLAEKAFADESNWHASAEEAAFLAEVSALSGQPLPREAIRSASVDLGFLLMAGYAIEATLSQLKETLDRTAGPQR